MDDQTFFLVWNPTTGRTQVRHRDAASAERESERLAREHPGQQFYVLRAESFALVRDPVTRVRLTDIPF